MSINIYTDPGSITNGLKSYHRAFLDAGTNFYVVELSGEDCAIDVRKTSIPLTKIFKQGVCLFLNNLRRGRSGILPPKRAHSARIEQHVSFYKFATVADFLDSSHRSWWSGDFFFSDGILFDNLSGKELSSVWAVVSLTLQNLGKYGALYAVMEHDTELIFLSDSSGRTLIRLFDHKGLR